MKTKTFVNRIMLAAGIALGAQGLFADTGDTRIEQHQKRKQGTYSRAEEARLREARNSVAFRAQPVPPKPSWVDVHRSVKQGQ